MKPLLLALTLIMSAVFSLTSCQSETSAKQTLTITGSSTVAPVMAEIAKRYESVNPDIRVDVQTGGSSRGIADARRGLADIGMISRALKANETDLNGHLLALDGLAVIVHQDNPTTALSDAQIKAIFTGTMTDWHTLSPPHSGQVTVVSKASGRSTLEVFLAHFNLKESAIKASIIIGDNEQGIKTVAGNPQAIGYVSIGAAEYQIQQGVPIRALPLNNIAASTANVANGKFPLARELNMVSHGTPTPLAEAFIAYAQSAAVHDLIMDLSLVPVTH